jgi:hypothetical protein
MELLTLENDDGEAILVDAVEVRSEGEAIAAGARAPITVDDAVEKLKDAFGVIGKTGKSFLTTFREMKTDQATLKMGIGFTAEGKILIAKAGAAVNFEITLTWKAEGNSQ